MNTTSSSSAIHPIFPGGSVHSVRSESNQEPSPRTVSTIPHSEKNLPMRNLPGTYGLPFFGAVKDRLDFFYFQGREKFFQSRVDKYNSTVFRSNMPPGPFIAKDPKVIVLLDAKSFPILFDISKVDKTDLFTGTYMPSTKLTGGYRILSYLDPSEPMHTKLKTLIFYLLSSRREFFIPQFKTTFTELFETIEKTIATSGKVAYNDLNDQACFNFLGGAYFSKNPTETKLGTDGPKHIQTWVGLNLHPILSLGLPWFIEDPLLHTFPLPAFLAKSSYQKLYDYFSESATQILDEAEKLGINKDEACHNILFATCFNTFGGMKILFPNLLKWIGKAGPKLQNKLGKEIRTIVESNGGKLTMKSMEEMPLMKSVVYETLRIEPPVPLQYARAKKDLVIENHENAFEIKKGEMLFGFQPFATKDPKIFENGEEFIGDRFMGPEGEKLLKYVLWSNGPETEEPSVGNKQCAGKDFVVFVSRLLVVELFLRYESFEVEVDTSPLGSAVTITSVKRAST